jgi:hypothetical protein
MNGRMSRWTLISSAVVICILTLAIFLYERNSYERAYGRLTRGATKADVLRLFGKPKEIGNCLYSGPSWDGALPDEISKTCIETYEYYRRTSIGRWDVGFNKDGQVVSKAYLPSP